jgi:hypothetical protein
MDTIFLNGKEMPIRMSYGAIRKTQIEMKTKGLTAGADDLEVIPIQIFYGLQFGAKKMGEEFNYTIEDVNEWLDDLEVTEVHTIADKIAQMLGVGTNENTPEKNG